MSVPRLTLHLIGERPTLPRYASDTLRRVPFLREYVSARVSAENAGSWLGPVWLLLTPLLSAALYFVVFGMLLGVRRQVENYPLFLLTGVLLYAFVSKSITASSKSIRKDKDFVRTIPFPRILVPLTVIGVQTRHLVWAVAVLVSFAALTAGVHISWIAFGGALALLVFLTTGIALMVARVGAAIPDTSGLVPFAVRAGAYLSAVYFPLSVMTDNAPSMARVLSWNPVAVGLDIARAGLSGTWGTPQEWLLLSGSAAVSLLVGVLVFWRGEPGYGHV